jgi:hypothetical protein
MLARFRCQLLCERAYVPEDAVVVVVSGGDSQLLNLYRPAWHFPRAADGGPGEALVDGEEAIAHLEELRTEGARFLLVPAISAEWLARYSALREHLDARYKQVWNDKSGLLFELS